MNCFLKKIIFYNDLKIFKFNLWCRRNCVNNCIIFKSNDNFINWNVVKDNYECYIWKYYLM